MVCSPCYFEHFHGDAYRSIAFPRVAVDGNGVTTCLASHRRGKHVALHASKREVAKQCEGNLHAENGGVIGAAAYDSSFGCCVCCTTRSYHCLNNRSVTTSSLWKRVIPLGPHVLCNGMRGICRASTLIAPYICDLVPNDLLSGVAIAMLCESFASDARVS